MLCEIDYINEEIEDIQKKLETYPPGKLMVSNDRGKYKLYVKQEEKIKYLPKSQYFLAEEMAAKKYLSIQLKNLLQEKRAIRFYLKHHVKESDAATQLLCCPPYQELLSSFFQISSLEMQKWVTADYERNSSYPENLIHKSISGNILRSKSEAIIDMELYTQKIPYRYECMLQLGEVKLFPDFTIMHPRTQKIYYWEHFGMMDNPSYLRNAYSKLQLYGSYGIIPSVHLIVTFETKEVPLNSELVHQMTHYYFQ